MLAAALVFAACCMTSDTWPGLTNTCAVDRPQDLHSASMPGLWDKHCSVGLYSSSSSNLSREAGRPTGAALCVQVAFVLPTSYPVTRETLNYAGAAVGIVMVGAVLVWFLPRVGARHWYRGEIQTYKPELEQVPLPNPY